MILSNTILRLKVFIHAKNSDFIVKPIARLMFEQMLGYSNHLALISAAFNLDRTLG